MINPFYSALQRIYATIPYEILEAAFRPQDFGVSMDERIKSVIIEACVLTDCNINAGKYKRIPLRSCNAERIMDDPGIASIADISIAALYRIPPEQRENRDIVGVIDVSYPFDYNSYGDSPLGFGISGNSVGSLAGAVLESHTHRGAALTPTPYLMANNMVMINPTNSFLNDWILICRLGYDAEFTNLPNASIKPLSGLIITAVKRYIWVNLTIRIGAGELSGGQELGQFKTIVDSYQSAIDQYEDDLQKFRGAAIFDVESFRDIVRMML